jgi:hypothetical protein
VRFHIDSVAVPVELIVEMTVTPADSIGDDTATVIPPNWWFIASEASDDTIGGCSNVISSNAPASYFVEVRGADGIVNLFNSGGTTNDNFCFWIDPTQKPPGIYCDTLVYHVSGTMAHVWQPVCLEIKPAGSAGDTGWVIPDTLFFTFDELYMPAYLPADSVWLGSSNGPAPYIAEVPLANPLFTIVADSVGITNDWVEILVNPSVVPVGTHRNIVRFHIDSVAVPVELILEMTIVPADSSDTLESAWAIPDHLYFEAELGQEALLSGSVLLQSSNAPAAWTGEVLCCGANVTTLLDTTGVTNDSARIVVDPTLTTGIGIYVDTVSFSVDSVPNLVPVFVTLEITDSLPTDTTLVDSAWVEPTLLSALVLAGSPDTVLRYAHLNSSNAPAVYSGFVLGFPSIASLPDSVGTTPDSVRVVFDATGLDVGTYSDSIVFDVQGVTDPVLLFVQLTVHSMDSMAQRSVTVYPNPFNPVTTIEFALRAGAPVELVLYNILGKRVRTLHDGWLPSGTHRVTWDGLTNGGLKAASGVYLYRLRIRDVAHTGKMFLMR